MNEYTLELQERPIVQQNPIQPTFCNGLIGMEILWQALLVKLDWSLLQSTEQTIKFISSKICK